MKKKSFNVENGLSSAVFSTNLQTFLVKIFYFCYWPSNKDDRDKIIKVINIYLLKLLIRFALYTLHERNCAATIEGGFASSNIF